MIITKEVIKELSKDLALPFSGMEQDWDLEMADANRVVEFIQFYKQSDLTAEKKLALMSILLASYDDYLNEYNIESDYKWVEIQALLKRDKVLFFDLIKYWSLESQKDIFRITPLIRELNKA